MIKYNHTDGSITTVSTRTWPLFAGSKLGD